MDNKALVLPESDAVILSREAADALIRSGDGKAALLYIHIIRNSGTLDALKAGRELSFSGDEVRNAAAVLEKSGLLCNKYVCGSDTPPEYTVEDIKVRMAETPEFSGLVQETQRRLGKVLTGADLVALFGIYDYLGMPVEVVLLLITHCIEEYRRRYGEGRVPTLRFIEKEAYAWARLDIFTQERAEEFLRRRIESRLRTAELKKIFRISKRELSPTEEKYIQTWVDMGFDNEALELAYDRTVIKTGNMSWAYMNSIVKSWHQKGLHTVAEITEKDGRGNVKKPAETAASSPTREDYERVKRYLDRMKQD